MVGDHIESFSEGDLVFMGPFLPHVWVNDPEFVQGRSAYPADAVVVQFVDNFLGKPFMEIPEMEAFLAFLKLSQQGIEIKGPAREKIATLMVQMLSLNGLQRLSALLTIFDILTRNTHYKLLASPGFTQNTNLKSSDHFRRINEYIMQNFQEEISLTDMASVANMGVTTLCNFFKEHYRVTFVEYLNTIRVGHACKLLSEKDMNVVEVAYECGFNNLANFNRQFKKFKQVTPSEYRKMLNIEWGIN